MFLVFIDGPIRGETMTWKDAPPDFRVPLPKRVITCECNDEIEEFSKGPEVFTYYRICVGQNVAIYSKEKSDEQIVHSLRQWIVSDLTHDWHMDCRDRRAFQ